MASALPPTRRRRTSPPAVPDELVEDILLRLPPNDPACLLRASLVCKAWGGIVSDPVFRRRLHELYPAPPVLGFLHGSADEDIPHFVHTTASPFSLAAPDWRSWRAVDCRHGRALFLSKRINTRTWELLLWEPLTGAQQRIPVPAAFNGSWPAAAVLCAVDGCDHRDCLGGPFRVVFAFAVDNEDVDDYEEYVNSAGVYSSETGTWGELTSTLSRFIMFFEEYSSLLVGRSLLYFMSDAGMIMEYDVARHGLAILDPPDCQPGYKPDAGLGWDCRFKLMIAEDGGLGVCEESGLRLKLWAREATDGTDARWVVRCTICMENLLPARASAAPVWDADNRVIVMGFAEGPNVIFVDTVIGILTIDPQSGLVTKVQDDRGFCNLIPVVSFYTPAPRREDQNLLASTPCEEAGGEWEKMIIDDAFRLIDESSEQFWML
ncbi:uncharacterized protein LOC123397354 [Hordeum vulgare subsp. vulgare]|uniref:F-box domain-containing protein n=1 Tax=Hordeum vulgare subsp. vulgare TaxID=112509 RepID=A0A8I6YX00_HORVV|nr:uncharacterized protein LOC123397354 [Hordeum vulgare subsp. vulgare]